jgi:hypothetical protein
MTRRRPCPAAPGPLEEYAVRFDDLSGRLAQRRGFLKYLAGLLAPRNRNKTLTALAGAEPVTGAQHPAVQRLQFFLSESRWDAERVNARRLGIWTISPAWTSSASPPAAAATGRQSHDEGSSALRCRPAGGRPARDRRQDLVPGPGGLSTGAARAR